MTSHKHARLTPYGRALLVRRMLEEGLRAEDAAQAAGVSPRTAYKWRRRYLDEGEAGLEDRTSRPVSCPHQTPQAVREQIITLRRQRRTYLQIHWLTGVSMSTIGRVLTRAGLNRLSVLDPPPPARRYTWDKPGQMLHLDVKKLGRFYRPGHRVTGSRRMTSEGAGWDYVHVAVDTTPSHSGPQNGRQSVSSCSHPIGKRQPSPGFVHGPAQKMWATRCPVEGL